MLKPHLHLDADNSGKSLYRALLDLGHDVARTPNEWMPLDASDDSQLLGAAAQGRCIFTHNARDFIRLAKEYKRHQGMILATQRWSLSGMIFALVRLLSDTDAQDWIGQVRWLNDWR
jgi:hypothetical protein